MNANINIKITVDANGVATTTVTSDAQSPQPQPVTTSTQSIQPVTTSTQSIQPDPTRAAAVATDRRTAAFGAGATNAAKMAWALQAGGYTGSDVLSEIAGDTPQVDFRVASTDDGAIAASVGARVMYASLYRERNGFAVLGATRQATPGDVMHIQENAPNSNFIGPVALIFVNDQITDAVDDADGADGGYSDY